MRHRIFEPPRLAERVLKAALPSGAFARTVLGDLREELADVAREQGKIRAGLWYWRQAISIGMRYVFARGQRQRRGRHRGDGVVRSVYQDLRFAFRSMRRAPGIAFTGVLTLAIGIGTATALFAVLYRVVLKPLAYPDPEAIVSVSEDNPGSDMPAGYTSLPNYLDWKRKSNAFEALALFRGRSMSITGDGQAQYVYGAYVTPEFFPAFGVPPLLGRTFAEAESVPDHDQAAVLAYGSWQRLYGGLDSIVGREILVDGRARTVVGVMPRGFNAPAGWISSRLTMDLWIPFPVEADRAPDARKNRSFSVVGRLRRGVGLGAARAEMELLHARSRVAHPETNEGWMIQLLPWHEMVVGRARPPLFLVFGAVSLLLLIACSNVATLELNRLLSRRGELSVRAGLGAGRLRLVRQMLTESAARTIVGALGGLVLSAVLIELIVTLHPGDLPRLDEISMDPGVFGGAFAFTLVAVLISGLGPAVEVLRREPRLRIGVSSSHRMQSGVVIVQLGLSMVLLVGSGLLARSFYRLAAVAPGLDPNGVLTATVALSWERVATLPERAAYVRDVLEELTALPGVDQVAMINSLPFSGSNQYQPVSIEGAPVSDPSRRPACALRGISPGYFRSMGITLVEGREFDERDVERTDVVIVSRTAAALYWPSQEPLGRRVAIGESDRWHTIVGVVDDVKHWGLRADVIPELYQPYTEDTLTSKSFVMRTAGNPEHLVPVVRETILSVDPDQPIRDLTPMRDYVDASLAPARFQATMLAAASTFSLVVAGVGLFSVMAVSATERRHEIGIRMALGAERGGLVQLLLLRALALSVAGVGGGLVASFLLARLVESLLFGVSTLDPMAYLLAVISLLAVALAASYVPVSRASRLAPAQTLRSHRLR